MGRIINIKWGIDRLKESVNSGDLVVIIDTIRFTSAVTTAIALGFVIEPTSDKERKSETFSLSPRSFLGKPSDRVVIASSNGAFMAINSKGAKEAIFGSLLNAKSIGEYIDSLSEKTTIIASGELGYEVRKSMFNDYEKEKVLSNPIFASEDFLAAGAIASFCEMSKSDEVKEAQEFFESNKKDLLGYLKSTASHKYNVTNGNDADTEYCSKLNVYNVVPKLRWVSGVPEITGLTSV